MLSNQFHQADAEVIKIDHPFYFLLHRDGTDRGRVAQGVEDKKDRVVQQLTSQLWHPDNSLKGVFSSPAESALATVSRPPWRLTRSGTFGQSQSYIHRPTSRLWRKKRPRQQVTKGKNCEHGPSFPSNSIDSLSRQVGNEQGNGRVVFADTATQAIETQQAKLEEARHFSFSIPLWFTPCTPVVLTWRSPSAFSFKSPRPWPTRVHSWERSICASKIPSWGISF